MTGVQTCALPICLISGSIAVSEPAVLAVTSTQVNATCNGDTDGSINLNVSGGSTSYTYSWTGPNSFTATTEDISALEAGTYDVTVTDSLGCTQTLQVIKIGRAHV